jgi:hypothetical protein
MEPETDATIDNFLPHGPGPHALNRSSIFHPFSSPSPRLLRISSDNSHHGVDNAQLLGWSTHRHCVSRDPEFGRSNRRLLQGSVLGHRRFRNGTPDVLRRLSYRALDRITAGHVAYAFLTLPLDGPAHNKSTRKLSFGIGCSPNLGTRRASRFLFDGYGPVYLIQIDKTILDALKRCFDTQVHAMRFWIGLILGFVVGAAATVVYYELWDVGDEKEIALHESVPGGRMKSEATFSCAYSAVISLAPKYAFSPQTINAEES